MNMGSPFTRKSGAAIQSLAFAEDRSQPIQIRFASFIMPSCFVFPVQKTLTGEGPHRMAMKADVLPLSHRFDEMVPTQLLSLLRSFNPSIQANEMQGRVGLNWVGGRMRARASLAFFPRPPT